VRNVFAASHAYPFAKRNVLKAIVSVRSFKVGPSRPVAHDAAYTSLKLLAAVDLCSLSANS
jgi:kynureninase